jgi:DNA-binding NarL/FixJ family response regulator
MTPLSTHRLTRLTLRKVTILLHLEAGRSYKQIAAALGIHEETVRSHVQAIAEALPPVSHTLTPQLRVMLWCHELLRANADVVAHVSGRPGQVA